MAGSDGEDESGTSRLTFCGDEGELASKVGAMQKKIGTLTLITYSDESAIPAKSRLVRGPKGVDGNIEFLEIIHDFQPNLSFSKETVTSVLKTIVKDNSMKFKDTKEKEQWIEAMSRRWRNLCRNVSQAEMREPMPKWMLTIIPWHWNDAQPSDQETQITDTISGDEGIGAFKNADEADGPIEYETSFSSELMLPLRQRIGGNGAWEPGMMDLSDLPDASNIVGRWPDGFTVEMKETIEFVKGLTRQSRSSGPEGSEGSLWEGEHIATKHVLTLCQRPDRKLLLSLFEQGRQILQVRMDHFGELDDPNTRLPRDSEILKKAVEFMKPIAELFAKNKIQKDELSSVRDNLLKKMLGPNAPTRRVWKKPAAADKDPKLDEKSSKKKDECKDSSASSSGPNTTPNKRPASANGKRRISFAKKSISKPEIKKETEKEVKKET